jgi:hypothetical protein
MAKQLLVREPLIRDSGVGEPPVAPWDRETEAREPVDRPQKRMKRLYEEVADSQPSISVNPPVSPHRPTAPNAQHSPNASRVRRFSVSDSPPRTLYSSSSLPDAKIENYPKTPFPAVADQRREMSLDEGLDGYAHPRTPRTVSPKVFLPEETTTRSTSAQALPSEPYAALGQPSAGLGKLADDLSDLSITIKMAMNKLPSEYMDDLAIELENDWMLEEMNSMVKGVMATYEHGGYHKWIKGDRWRKDKSLPESNGNPSSCAPSELIVIE